MGVTLLSHPMLHWLSVLPTWLIILLDLICSEGEHQRVSVQLDPVVKPLLAHSSPCRTDGKVEDGACLGMCLSH